MRTLALLGIFLLAGGAQALSAAPAQRAVNADAVALRAVLEQEDQAAPLRKASASAALDYARSWFWTEPGWSRLENYASTLREQHRDVPQQGPFPRDEALERMKAYLARGTQGPKPAPFDDWADLKRKAARLEALIKIPAAAQGKHDASDLASSLIQATGLDYAYRGEEIMSKRQLSGLIAALEFAKVAPSLFRSEAQVAPPGSSAEQARGRFGIIVRDVIKPRRAPEQSGTDDNSPGFYDMLSHTAALVRPVQRVQLSRDGSLRGAPSVIRKTETLWREAEEPMCSRWIPGFAYGAADPAVWRFFRAYAGERRKLSTNAPGSVFAFYTTLELPPGPATVREAGMTLDRSHTAFAGGTHLYYDLDADGIADLALWEGQGTGPGDFDTTAGRNDRWYRLMLVNINGAWKVLGSDTFSYGCGC